MHAAVLTIILVTNSGLSQFDQGDHYLGPYQQGGDSVGIEEGYGGLYPYGATFGHGALHVKFGPMPQSCYAPRYGCYPGNQRFTHRYPAFHGWFYRRPNNYRNVFDYPWHAGLHEPTSLFSNDVGKDEATTSGAGVHESEAEEILPPAASRQPDHRTNRRQPAVVQYTLPPAATRRSADRQIVHRRTDLRQRVRRPIEYDRPTVENTFHSALADQTVHRQTGHQPNRRKQRFTRRMSRARVSSQEQQGLQTAPRRRIPLLGGKRHQPINVVRHASEERKLQWHR